MVATAVLLVTVLAASGAAQECSVPSQRVQCGWATCNETSRRCDRCTTDEQCWESALECFEGRCRVASIQKNFGGGIIGAIAVAILVCGIAAVAGVGGGGILVPLFSVLLGLPLKQAVGLSQATITGQSMTNVAFQLFRHHPQHSPPNPTRPLVNYVLVTFWLPASLAGTTLGGLAGRVVADWMRLGALFSLLSYVLYRVIKRLIAQRRADQALARIKEQEMAQLTSSPTGTAPEAGGSGGGKESPVPVEVIEAPPSGYPQFPLREYLLVAATFIPLVLMTLLRSPTLGVIGCGTGGFWMAIAATVGYNFAFSTGLRVVLSRRVAAIASGMMDAVHVPFKWDVWTSVVFPIVSITAGGAASLLGIGGGLVLSFLLLEAGLTPEQGSATSGFATFLVAGASLLAFLINQAVPLDYAAVFFVAGIASTFLGQFVFVREIRKRGWRFLIVGALAFIMGGSMVSLAAVGLFNTIELIQHDGSLGFGSIC